MISMVWPDIEVTISPGRCALPSGMFSTRPMAPTTLTFAFRAASACISPTTQAAPPMSPFMSSMLAAGLMEMPPVSKQTPLPIKATGCIAALAAVPAHDHGPAGLRGALGDAEQRAHSEFRHGLDVENLDLDAKLAQLAGAAREFHREQHVGRLVDEVARGDDAIDDMRVRREGLSRRGHIADRDRNVGAQRGVLAVLFLGLVAIEFIGAQPDARGDRGRLLGLHGAVRQFRDDRHGVIAGAQFAGDHAAKFEKIIVLEGRELAGADHDQARDLETLRRQDIERRTRFFP